MDDFYKCITLGHKPYIYLNDEKYENVLLQLNKIKDLSHTIVNTINGNTLIINIKNNIKEYFCKFCNDETKKYVKELELYKYKYDTLIKEFCYNCYNYIGLNPYKCKKCIHNYCFKCLNNKICVNCFKCSSINCSVYLNKNDKSYVNCEWCGKYFCDNKHLINYTTTCCNDTWDNCCKECLEEVKTKKCNICNIDCCSSYACISYICRICDKLFCNKEILYSKHFNTGICEKCYEKEDTVIL